MTADELEDRTNTIALDLWEYVNDTQWMSGRVDALYRAIESNDRASEVFSMLADVAAKWAAE